MGRVINKKGIIISAIVSTYNSEKFIRGKLDDLLEQTVSDKLEIIVVNSGSLQNEDKIICEYQEKFFNIKYIKTEQRETIYKAWNRAIRIAEGQFITNANTDDRLKKDALEILSKELIENSDVALVYADQYVTNEANKKFDEIKIKKIEMMPEFDYLIQLDRCLVFSQPMWRASLHFNDNIWFDEKLEICGDHEFHLNLSLKYKMKHLPVVLGAFYLDPLKNNLSHRNIDLVEEERKYITFLYMRRYLENLTKKKLSVLLKRFLFFTRIPITLFLLIVRVESLIFKKKHVFYLEFTYLFTSLIFEYLQQYDNAINCCKKFLRKRKSVRIEQELNRLKTIIRKQGK